MDYKPIERITSDEKYTAVRTKDLDDLEEYVNKNYNKVKVFEDEMAARNWKKKDPDAGTENL